MTGRDEVLSSAMREDESWLYGHRRWVCWLSLRKHKNLYFIKVKLKSRTSKRQYQRARIRRVEEDKAVLEH